MTKRVVLRSRRARPFFGRHPWVFAGAIEAVVGDPADGDEVDLITHEGGIVARGLYNSRSKIRVRLYSWEPGSSLDAAFFRERLRAAIQLRQQLGLEAADGACRLVNSEGDGLSGLIVDRYADWLVVQFTALGLAVRREMLADLLMELLRPSGIYVRTERGVGHLEGLELHDGPLRGEMPESSISFIENGLTFRVNLAEGQKTGFYLDQRDNRQVVAGLAKGRRVLDAFCYSGGFGLFAARAGATEVIGVDQSEPALALALENARANGLEDRMKFVRDDVFDHLEEQVGQGERYGLIILDPPKFARARHAIDEALRGYRRLQSLALRLLEPDGLLVICCCSGLITIDMLQGLLSEIAAEMNREIRLLEIRGAARDHPVSVACLESQYLKCVIAG